MVIRISDKTQDYSNVTKLLVKPIILYNRKNEVVLEGQVNDIRKECEKYHNVEVTFVSGRADTTGLKIWLDM